MNDITLKACTDIVSEVIKAVKSDKEPNIVSIRARVAAHYKLPTQPKLVDIISAVPENHRKELLPYLRAKPVRTASGVAVVAVMCKPHRCPHIATTGNVCVY